MNYDLALTIGLLIGVFSIPAMVSALSDRRSPRVAAIVMIVAGGLVVYAVTQKPGGYRIDEIPDAIINVIARFIG
ncbi:hypothetical protein [Aquicoccus porphyridii]|uniref:50S ribosomal protein L35 n=1 Tax=Aquicoccus porphyridii TaxID=1852029 RepID=A0A5A9ZKL2_9RHOB|nr:hypothetical protein [Aquicoccus porphyridii]KAA0917572.1 hypothetical protein FLO80_05920 [Aquicoccus porphyridii]RAI55651.1 hypothetical protein DOO74_04445 [Rhodobacteraceae bacterium AsT-22]